MEIATVDLSVIIALIALFYAIREINRNNKIIIKIKECSTGGTQSIYENNTKKFSFFKITIQNKGINLYCPKMSLSFRHEKGGIFNLPLRQKKQKDFAVDTFSKGMITTFHFKTYELDKHDLKHLDWLRDMRKQDASLCLYSQNYLAKVFQIDCFADRLKQKWNWLSYRFSFSKKKGKNWGVIDIVKHYQLPTFQTLGHNIEWFIKSCSEQSLDKNQKDE